MNQHLIVVAMSDGKTATLRDRRGETLELPVAWLPTGTEEGSALILEVTAGSESSTLSLRTVEGTSVPGGADVGA